MPIIHWQHFPLSFQIKENFYLNEGYSQAQTFSTNKPPYAQTLFYTFNLPFPPEGTCTVTKLCLLKETFSIFIRSPNMVQCKEAVFYYYETII